MTDIVDRLRSPEVFIVQEPMTSRVAYEAADEIERLREALKFYADKYNYRTSTVYMCGHSGPHNIDSDGGNKARAALKEGK